VRCPAEKEIWASFQNAALTEREQASIRGRKIREEDGGAKVLQMSMKGGDGLSRGRKKVQKAGARRGKGETTQYLLVQSPHCAAARSAPSKKERQGISESKRDGAAYAREGTVRHIDPSKKSPNGDQRGRGDRKKGR